MSWLDGQHAMNGLAVNGADDRLLISFLQLVAINEEIITASAARRVATGVQREAFDSLAESE